MGHRPFPKVHGKLQLYTRKKISLHCEGGQTLEQEPTEAVGSLEILKTVLDVALSNLIQQDLVWQQVPSGSTFQPTQLLSSHLATSVFSGNKVSDSMPRPILNNK